MDQKYIVKIDSMPHEFWYSRTQIVVWGFLSWSAKGGGFVLLSSIGSFLFWWRVLDYISLFSFLSHVCSHDASDFNHIVHKHKMTNSGLFIILSFYELVHIIYCNGVNECRQIVTNADSFNGGNRLTEPPFPWRPGKQKRVSGSMLAKIYRLTLARGEHAP